MAEGAQQNRANVEALDISGRTVVGRARMLARWILMKYEKGGIDRDALETEGRRFKTLWNFHLQNGVPLV